MRSFKQGRRGGKGPLGEQGRIERVMILCQRNQLVRPGPRDIFWSLE